MYLSITMNTNVAMCIVLSGGVQHKQHTSAFDKHARKT